MNLRINMRNIVNSLHLKNLSIEYNHYSDLIDLDFSLRKLKSKPNGKALLEEIERLNENGRKVHLVIDQTLKNNSHATLSAQEILEYDALDDDDLYMLTIAYYHSILNFNGEKGKGSNAVIQWNPFLSSELDRAGKPNPSLNSSNNFINLGHHLIHAFHMMEGSVLIDPILENLDNEPSTLEEKRVIGMNEFRNERFSENSLRNEHGLTFRMEI